MHGVDAVVEGARVVSIDADGVTVLHHEKPVSLTLETGPPPVGPRRPR